MSNFETVVGVYHQARDGSMVYVAQVTAPYSDTEQALEYAYHATQNLAGSWSKGDIMIFGEKNRDYNPRVLVINPPAADEMGKRSTMVGDVMFCQAGKFEVAPFGFNNVSVDEDVA